MADTVNVLLPELVMLHETGAAVPVWFMSLTVNVLTLIDSEKTTVKLIGTPLAGSTWPAA